MDQGLTDRAAQRHISKVSQLNLGGGSVYPYEDVTSLLDSATKDMKTGQLVQLDSFSLFDAMCAIVIMDPKMDTGMIVDDYATRPQYDVNRLLDPKEFIWVIDNILVGQMTWLSGHALSQTLFTSCYILRLFEIDVDDGLDTVSNNTRQAPASQFVSVVLKACVLAIAKTCALVSTEMRKGHVYEEEDFMTNGFGVSLYENFPTSSLIAMLDQAEYWIANSGKNWIESSYGAEASELLKGVMERIYYARALPQLEDMRKHVQELKATHSLGVQVDGAFDHTVHRKLVTNTPPRAIALLTSDETFEQLDQMCADLAFIGQALRFPDAPSLLNFFIRFARQKPAPGAFSRSILQTVLYNDRIIMGSRLVQDVVRESIQETVAPARWIFESFDALQAELETSSPHTLESIPELEEDEAFSLKRQIQAKAMLFVEKAVKPFVDTLQIVGQNSSRQRRNLRKIVQSWETLQEEAEAFDEEIHLVSDEIRDHQELELKDDPLLDSPLRPFYFVSWVYHMKLWVMEWLLRLGFELELYSTFEYSMVYGYIDCVLGAHAQHLRRVQTIIDLESQQGAKESSAAQKKKKKKKKKKSTGADNNQPETVSCTTTLGVTAVIRATQDLVTIRLELARAVFLVLAALTKVGHLSTTPPHLASHGLNDLETLYRHRFKAFHHLASPEAMTFEGYLHRLDCDGLEAWQVLEFANDFFTQAKMSLDRFQSLSARDARIELCEDASRQDIKKMIKVCIASKIAITGLQKDARVLEQKEYKAEAQKRSAASASARSGKIKDQHVKLKSPTRKPHFEWKYHSEWPIITLV